MTDARTSRRRPRRILDPRLLIGALLVVASAAGVVVLVGAADASGTVYAARDTLTPGQRVRAADLVPVRARLDEGSGRYLAPGAVPAVGVVMTRTVGAGELVPRSAVGAAADVDLAAVVLHLDGQVSRAVAPGAVVDVWAAEQQEQGRYGAPEVVAPAATVVRLVDDTALVAGGGRSVEVLVPRDRVARVLEAAANDAALSLLPLAASAGE